MNAFLVDCEYLSRVCSRLRVDLSQMTGRALPEADLARWLECAMLDCQADSGDAPASMPENMAADSTQVYLFHEEGADVFEHFRPAVYATELDGQAFCGPAGEFMLAVCPVRAEFGSKETLFCETLQSLLRTGKARHIVVAADFDAYGPRIDQLLSDFPEAPVVLLSLSPEKNAAGRAVQMGFSLLAALGLRSSEFG